MAQWKALLSSISKFDRENFLAAISKGKDDISLSAESRMRWIKPGPRSEVAGTKDGVSKISTTINIQHFKHYWMDREY